jgi:SAM-dependent methyltransferase
MASRSDDVERNRAFWNKQSAEYQESHRGHIDRGDTRWGVWQIPDAELGVLGDVAGLDVLELGCGAGQFGQTLADRGANVIGIDLSAEQLTRAQVTFDTLEASADDLPFDDARFALVVCDWGATTFADPYAVVPEVARVLRPGGVFAFSGGTAIEWCCWSEAAQRPERELLLPYFGMHRHEDAENVTFMLGSGDWIRLFRANGLEVLDLVEPRPAADATSTYRDDYDRDWAREYPMEQIWKVRKR